MAKINNEKLFDTDTYKNEPIPCGRCGRLLKNPKSIIRKYGASCFKKLAGTKTAGHKDNLNQIDLFQGDK